MASGPAEPPASADFYEFGPFRLDVASRGLYRSGPPAPPGTNEYVALTPKAFEILLVLVQDAGRVVTKEQLLQRVWPDAFVEEGSISNNISALRKILNPDFEGEGPIATVARRGYRFSAAVRLRNAQAEIALVSEAPPPVAASAASTAELVETPQTGPPTLERASWATANRFNARQVGIAASVILVLGAIGIGVALRRTPASQLPAGTTVRRSVAVLPMKNLSGQAEYGWFSTALSETISAELAAGGQLRLISGAAVAEMQQELSPPPGVGLNRKQLDEIGRNLGCDLILTGNFLPSGGQIRVEVRLDDIVSGGPVASLSVVEDERKLLDLVASASRELRAKLGLSPPLAGQTAGLRAALSSNPNALRFYFLGLEALRIHEGARATELLTQALTEDPNFALAHSVLSITWRVLGYDLRAQEEAKRAFDLSGRLGREDQLGVEGIYYEVMSDWPKAIEKYQALWNFFPDNIAYGLKLIHQQLIGGKLEEAQRVLDQMKALPPPADSDPRVNLVGGDLAFRLGNYADALAEGKLTADKAAAKKASQLQAVGKFRQGNASYRLGQLDDAERYLAEATQIFERIGDTGGVGDSVRSEAIVLLGRDRVDEAAQRLDSALEMATRINNPRLASEIRISRSNVAREQGRLATAKTEAEAALAGARETQNRSGIARAQHAFGSVLRVQGEYVAARASFEESARLAREIGEKPVYTATLNSLAGVDLAEGRIEDAERRLDEILPIDRQLGDKGALALRLANLSSMLGMQGHLAEAGKAAAEECAIHESLGAARAQAGCRVRLAALWMDEGRMPDARAAADRIAAESSASLSPIDLATLALVHLRAGDSKKAAAAIAQARRAIEGRASIPEQAIAVSIAGARIDIAAGRIAEAQQRLTQAKSEAERLGLLPLALDARLAMAQSGAPSGGSEVAAIERDARQAGLLLVANRARAGVARPIAQRKN